MSNLPNELMDEILLRLPQKALMRFKSVSRAWKNRLGSVEFVKYHADRKKKDSKKVMIYTYNFDRETLAYSFSLNHDENHAVEFVPHNFGRCRVVGSCDGLLLVQVYDHNKLCIWNPYTRECKDLLIPADIDSDCDRYGFGCASSLDKENHNNYKVLFIGNKWYGELEKRQCLVALYTSRTNSFRLLKNIPYEAMDYNHLVLVNAKLHFYARKLIVKMIIAFDIRDEEFKEMPSPDCDHIYSMAELKGNLCVVSYNKVTPLGRCACLWVMKEYGVKESWTKMLCFNLHDTSYPSMKPLHLHENTQILLLADSCGCNPRSSLLLINHDSEDVKAKAFKLDGAPSHYKAVAYEETLLSPNAI